MTHDRKLWSNGLARIAILVTAVLGTLLAAGFLLFIPNVQQRVFSTLNAEVKIIPPPSPSSSVSNAQPSIVSAPKGGQSDNGLLTARVIGTQSQTDSDSKIYFDVTPPASPTVFITPIVSPDNANVLTPASKPFRRILISHILLDDDESSRHEFVELYNPNNIDVDVTGWELRKKTSSGNDSVLVSSKKLLGTILAHGYFLISHPEYQQTIGADVVWSSDGYGISSNNTIVFMDSDGRMVDRVGFGEASDYESIAAENPGHGVALARKSESDTDNNRNDFICAYPNPRNTKSPKGFVALQSIPCVISTPPSPSPVSQVTPTPEVSPSPSPLVSETPSPVPIPTPSASGSPQASPSPIAPLKVLITEVQTTGGEGKTNDDFVELYNPNDSLVNLKGYRLVKRTKTGSSDYSVKSWTGDTLVQPHSFYVWANSDYTELTGMADSTTTTTLANDNAVAVRYGAMDTGQVVDSVGWGGYAGALCETQCVAANPGASESLARKKSGATFIDTDSNASDFEITAQITPKQ